MTHNTKPVSPLRQRMIEDMTLRKLSPKTQSQLYPGSEYTSPAFSAARLTQPQRRICAAINCTWSIAGPPVSCSTARSRPCGSSLA